MILKWEQYDEKNRLITKWLPNVVSATRQYSDDWQSDVLDVHFAKDEATEPGFIVLDGRNQGVYLCNDDGKTVDVLRRLQHPKFK